MLLLKKEYPKTCQYLLYFIIFLAVLSCSTDKTAMKEEPLFIPEESFNKANELIKEGKHEEAREILENIKTKDTSQNFAILARLRIADTYFEAESYDEAVVEYESFLDLYPHHRYASYAQYRLATCFFERIKTVDIGYSWAKRALDEFEKLQRRYPRNPYMDIIDNRIKECLNILAEYEFYVGSFYYKKGSYNAAIGRFKGMVQNYPETYKVPEALYYTGLSYEKLGQRDEAINSLTVLIEKYPNIEISVESKKLIDSFDRTK
jgi:outer membrane protein assembly factor BamD